MLNVNEVDNKGRNALFYAITGGSIILLQRLVTSGVKIQASTDGITVLMQVSSLRPLTLTFQATGPSPLP